MLSPGRRDDEWPADVVDAIEAIRRKPTPTFLEMTSPAGGTVWRT